MSVADFYQQLSVLPNAYEADVVLREHLARVLPSDVLAEHAPALGRVGEEAVSLLPALAAEAEREPPRVTHYDPWGRRIDEIHLNPAWKALIEHHQELGAVALAYDQGLGEHARVVQHAYLHLTSPVDAVASCPLSMTDAAARVLLDHAEPELRDRVVARLVSRDPARAWTSGQWMTEKPGGSDVGRTETVARPLPGGGYALDGVKWFTSATTSDCALALARTLDASGRGVGGSRGLGLYLVERVDPRDGRLQIGDTIRVRRLKDKLGTRAVPTAELDLEGAYANPVGPGDRGVKTISGMLNVTRWWNAVSAASFLRHGVTRAVAYGYDREAFGRRLLDHPLHAVTLAELAVEAEAAFALTFRASVLMGADRESPILRALMPVVKLLTARDAIAVASEVLEAFGGAGYIENTGLPVLLRDAQVLSIWEGTTNVLSLDLLRAAVREDALRPLLDDIGERLAGADLPALAEPVRLVASARDALVSAAQQWGAADADALEAGMRRYAMALGRTYAAALLVEHAAHRLAKHDDDRAARVAEAYSHRWLRHLDRLAPDAGQVAAAHAILTGVPVHARGAAPR